MTFINPLDLHTVLIDNLAGNWTIFLFMALIAFTIMAARFRMSNMIFGMLIAMFGLFMATFIQWFYVLILVISALAIFFIIARIFKT